MLDKLNQLSFLVAFQSMPVHERLKGNTLLGYQKTIPGEFDLKKSRAKPDVTKER